MREDFPKISGKEKVEKRRELVPPREGKEQKGEHYRTRDTEIISEIKQLEEQITQEHETTRNKLKIENEKLERELHKYRTSIPLPVYGGLVVGVMFTLYGLLAAADLIYLLSGISIVLVTLAAVIESKVRENRIR